MKINYIISKTWIQTIQVLNPYRQLQAKNYFIRLLRIWTDSTAFD